MRIILTSKNVLLNLKGTLCSFESLGFWANSLVQSFILSYPFLRSDVKKFSCLLKRFKMKWWHYVSNLIDHTTSCIKRLFHNFYEIELFKRLLVYRRHYNILSNLNCIAIYMPQFSEECFCERRCGLWIAR